MNRRKHEDGRTFTYEDSEDVVKKVVDISYEIDRWDLLKEALRYFFLGKKPSVIHRKDVDCAFFKRCNLEKAIFDMIAIEITLEKYGVKEDWTIRDAKDIRESLQTLNSKIGNRNRYRLVNGKLEID